MQIQNNENKSGPVGILLHGVSSAGKTTICKYLRELYPTPMIFHGVDQVWKLLGIKYVSADGDLDNLYGPHKKEGLGFIKCEDGTMEEFAGPVGEHIIVLYLKTLLLHYQHNMSFVSDYVIIDQDLLYRAATKFKDLNIYFISVKCDLDELNRREKFRGDRFVGTSENQYKYLFNFKHLEFDYSVDTTNQPDSEFLAKEIINYINNNKPHAFKHIYNGMMEDNTQLSRFNKDYNIQAA